MKMNSEWIRIGSFNVDSGQVLITDPCYLESFVSDEYDDKEIEKMQETGNYAYSYNGCCARTLENRRGGTIGNGQNGVVVPSGHGDGTYDVFVKMEGNIVKEIRIVF